jgi:protein-S-isoprenylcysteine O-methyltransferase Ste14
MVSPGELRPMPREASTTGMTQPPAGFAVSLTTVIMICSLPLIVYYIYFCLTFNHGRLVAPSVTLLKAIPQPTATSTTIVLGWLTFQALLQIYAPGKWVKGPLLLNGFRLDYKINGWSAWWITWFALTACVASGLFSPTVLADHFGELLSTTIIIACIFSCYLYWHGTRFAAEDQSLTNNALYNFWLGTSLNPRVKRFDLKLFCEGRPGLIGWIAINLSLAAKQFEALGHLTIPMILVCAFQFWYVADYFFHEEAILTTWDIKYENFGYMLCFGDLVWVPFTYTIQTHYLVNHSHDLPPWAVLAIVLLNIAGCGMFRGANLQKHRFRQDPKTAIWGKPAKFIRTTHGALLLTNGWWGLSRHMNYFGDLLMGLAWCLPCLFDSPLPYFYFIYFTILLVHRERRDNKMCATRYNSDWESYCAKVPYRIVPGVY